MVEGAGEGREEGVDFSVNRRVPTDERTLKETLCEDAVNIGRGSP